MVEYLSCDSTLARDIGFTMEDLGMRLWFCLSEEIRIVRRGIYGKHDSIGKIIKGISDYEPD